MDSRREVAAKAIYERMPYDGPTGTTKPPWVEGGNSLKQDEARKYADAALAAADAQGWRPISEAPRDGTPVDLWCVPPDDVEFAPERGGIRLTDCGWHEATDVFPHTGWARVTDDGHWDLVDGGPTAPYGLPRWVPTYFRYPPPPPGSESADAQQDTVRVPGEPTEAMWGGLARDLVMWREMEDRTGAGLYRYLENAGREIPDWLRAEIPDTEHVPPKGAVAYCIYRAAHDAAPTNLTEAVEALVRALDSEPLWALPPKVRLALINLRENHPDFYKQAMEGGDAE